MNKKLSILGFGNQAKAWALNLRDSGFDIFIGLREQSPSLDKAAQLGFKTFLIGEALPTETAAILAPDDVHESIIADIPNKKVRLIFAHGYSLQYQNIAKKYPQHVCLLLAPKAIASEVRLQYETGGKLGAVYSTELSSSSDECLEILKELAKGLGISSLYPSTVEAETKADLFSEQAILCSTLPYSALHAFNKLVEKGVNEETAYFECWYEVKLIADTMVRLGPEKFFRMISPNALAGSEVGKEELFDSSYLEKLERLYQNIDNGSFSETLRKTDFEALRKKVEDFWKDQPLTRIHQRLAKELF